MSDAKPFGYYWELYHMLSQEVVHTGFEKLGPKDAIPQDGDWRTPISSHGFHYRFTPLFSSDAASTNPKE